MEQIEIWKTIIGFEDYQVSNLGRVKSLQRIKLRINKTNLPIRERILKQHLVGKGYFAVNLYKDNKLKKRYVHQLVSICFLNHITCGHKLVVNHVDLNKLNNNLKNLEIVTNRQNSSLKSKKYSSNYVGVFWYKNTKKWRAAIRNNKKIEYLGDFNIEYNAHLAYQKRLKEIILNEQNIQT